LEKRLNEKTESYQLFQYRQSIAENLAHTGTWWWDLASKEQFWSDGMYQLLGYKAQSVTLNQQHLLKLIHPDHRKIFTDSLTLTLHEEQECSFEIAISGHFGTRRLKASFKLFHYEEKRIFIGLFKDITKEQQLQQELSERIQLADLLTEHLPDRILITNTENSILFWNKQCEKYYRQKREQVIGKNFFDVFPVLQTEEKIHQFNEVLKGYPVHQTGTQAILTKEIMDLHMLPLYNAEKEVVGILHILHDVTEEYRLRHNLTERLHFIQSLVEAYVDRVVALDHHMNYIYWNKRAEEYYNLQEYIGSISCLCK
jgi:PAS domain S-box-containing protein